MTALIKGQKTKVDHYNRTTQINFSMGPNVKFVFPIIDSI